jgi:hypothetical protein
MAWIAAVVSVAGTIFGASEQAKAGKAAKRAAQINANYEEAETEQADLEAKEQISRQRWGHRVFRGAQRAAVAGAGVVGTTGSPLDAMAETAAMQELQIQDMARTRQAAKKAGYARAAVIRAGGQASQRAMTGQAIANGIQGLGTAINYYVNRPKP